MEDPREYQETAWDRAEALALDAVYEGERKFKAAIKELYPDLTANVWEFIEDALDPQGLPDTVYIAIREGPPRTWVELCTGIVGEMEDYLRSVLLGEYDPPYFAEAVGSIPKEKALAIAKTYGDIVRETMLAKQGPDAAAYR